VPCQAFEKAPILLRLLKREHNGPVRWVGQVVLGGAAISHAAPNVIMLRSA